ncbi:hypothetical protein T02_5776 [Trichinella nativa]|uniref:Uncharacterized protein n=1 Tax=Trichinella nativa TaxID=6335 RepID=A0A0V1KRF0_9BILA|nr:hypothetical protein T02_5776 [Trichinella nativa]
MDDDIQKIPGKVANKDLEEIQSIAEVCKGKSNAQLIGMNIESAVCFKYAPVTSAEKYKMILMVEMRVQFEY